mgnify:CR=1 FL=1
MKQREEELNKYIGKIRAFLAEMLAVDASADDLRMVLKLLQNAHESLDRIIIFKTTVGD